MADADVLPYDYKTYGNDVVSYLKDAQQRATADHLQVDFTQANAAAARFAAAGARVGTIQSAPGALDAVAKAHLNEALRNAEEALLNDAGLPHRPWYKHTIYAPGEYTGYAAVVVPGVNEGIDAKDAGRTSAQLAVLAEALNRSSSILEQAAK
jgi:N-acetylated-alpha-linked acidic dipeptidase